MTEQTSNSKLLELAPTELVVPLKVTHAGRTYRVRHVLRPPASADWFAYEAALALAVEELPAAPDSDEPTFRLQMRSTDAALQLWNRLALRVEGYDLSAKTSGHGFSHAEEGGALVSGGVVSGLVTTPADRVGGTLGEWRGLIPLAHKEAAIRSLTLVAPAQLSDSANNDSTNNHFPLQAGEIPVVLEAALGGVAYPRLLHRFRPPSVEDERAYRRLLAETLIVRGGRTPRTLIPARLPALVRLYDQLILGVSGYTRLGQPLASSQEIARAMDVWHKRVAVQALFGDAAEGAPSEVPQSGTQEDFTDSLPEPPQ